MYNIISNKYLRKDSLTAGMVNFMRVCREGLIFKSNVSKNVFKGVFMLVIFLTVFCIGSAILNSNWTSSKYDKDIPEQYYSTNFDEFEE